MNEFVTQVSACFYLNYAKCPPGYSVTDSNGTAAESNGTADDATCTCKRQEEILDCDANHKYVLLAVSFNLFFFLATNA